jgi:hypothetical protein
VSAYNENPYNANPSKSPDTDYKTFPYYANTYNANPYNAPNNDYKAPVTSYNANPYNTNTYKSPDTDYKTNPYNAPNAPYTTYTTPSYGYNAPNNSYNAPMNQYNANPYNANPYNSNPYDAKPYNANPYNSNPYDAKPYNANPYNAPSTPYTTPSTPYTTPSYGYKAPVNTYNTPYNNPYSTAYNTPYSTVCRPQNISLVAVETYSTLTAKPCPGSQFYSTYDLYDEKYNTVIGKAVTVGTVIVVEPKAFTCTQTYNYFFGNAYNVPIGEIMFSGCSVAINEYPNRLTRGFIGGTGPYNAIKGQANIVNESPKVSSAVLAITC